MTGEIFISIIIPVYNAEAYLEKCLESIRTQIYENFEVLLIDDGSVDGSLEICKKYAEKDKRFCAFHQENQGVSAARNLGMQNCNGGVICFVDADDWVQDNFTKLIAENLGDADIIIFDGYICSANKMTENHCWKENRSFDGNQKKLLQMQAISFQYPQQYVPTYHGVGTAWGKAYKTDLIKKNGIKYDENLRISEDALFTLFAIEYANTIKYIKKCTYFYRNDNRSACRSYDPKLIGTMLKIIDKFEEFTDKTDCGKNDLNEAIIHRTISNLLLIIRNFIFESEKAKQQTNFREIMSNEKILKAVKNRKSFDFGTRNNIILCFCEKKLFYPLKAVIQTENLARKLLKNRN